MDKNRIVGAIRFPAFLMFWSLGLVLVVGKFDVADASSARTAILVSSPLTEPVRVDDSDALSREMSRALRRSEVFSGEWLPDDDREKVAATPTTDEAPGESADGQGNTGVGGVTARVVRITSETEISAKTKEKERSKVEKGFSKTASLSVVRKTRPRVDLGLVDVKQNARREIENGRISHAFRLLRASVDQGRNDPEYLGLLAVSALRSGNAAEASVVYERLLEMQPESERWWAGLALAREQQGMDATPVFQRMLALSEENTALKRLVRQKIGTFG